MSKTELYRPDKISIGPDEAGRLEAKLGLFGACASTTWRQEHFLPSCEADGLPVFNPQKQDWNPEDAAKEAHHLAFDSMIFLPITNESDGHASLAEAGWAILGGLMRGQDIHLYVEPADESKDQSVVRSRALFLDLATEIQRNFASYRLRTQSMKLAATLALQNFKDQVEDYGGSLATTRIIDFSAYRSSQKLLDIVGVFGTNVDPAQSPSSIQFIDNLRAKAVSIYNPRKPDWSIADIPVERSKKMTAKVLTQVIDSRSEGMGSLAESGLLASLAFVSGRPFGILIEDHLDEAGNYDPKSAANRTRLLVREHINKINQQHPGTVFLANTVDELTAFADYYSS